MIQICASRMTGEDQPNPLMGVFQATFSVSLQVIGSPVSMECPCPSGPRNCGQSAAAAEETWPP